MEFIQMFESSHFLYATSFMENRAAKKRNVTRALSDKRHDKVDFTPCFQPNRARLKV
jgi:hypothetical protein